MGGVSYGSVGKLVVCPFSENGDMSEFTGFKWEHFEYFILHNDALARRFVRDQITDFAACVQAVLRKSVDPFYKDFHIGKLDRSKSYCWVAFGPKPWKTCEGCAHQTMALGSDGLRMFVNVEGRSAAKKLKTAFEHHRDEFRAKLQDLHDKEPFELLLAEVFKGEMPMQLDSTPKLRLHSSLLTDDHGAWTAFAETAQRLPLLYFAIDRPAVSPTEAIEISKSKVVQLVVKQFERNHDLVKFLNKCH